MKAQVIKAISKKIIINLLILLIILALVITITGIPTDFDIYSYDGKHTSNMDKETILESIKNNFKILFNGEAFKAKIQGKTTGELLILSSKKSATVLFFGSLLAVLIGIPKGIIDSRKRNRNGTIKLLQSLIPLSVPDVLTIALVQLGAIYLFKNDISVFGLGPIPFTGDETLKQAIYPIISISILPAAYISRITANVIEENFEKLYILAARGKGLSRFQIIKNHMMKSVFYGVLSGFPTVIGIMFSSLIIVERLFYYQGIGFNLIHIYISPLVPAAEAGAGFTVFTTALAFFYYLVFMIFNGLKSATLPQIKSH